MGGTEWFWDLEWFNEVDVPKKLLSFSRHVDVVQACLADKVFKIR